ncbi:MAG TPA: acyl carrier protein [Gemmatimonadaceae bacterium]
MLSHNIEPRLRAIVARAALVSPDTIGPDDDLARAGVDSLSMLRAIAEVEAAFGVEIPDERFVCIRTLRTLVAAVEARLLADAA